MTQDIKILGGIGIVTAVLVIFAAVVLGGSSKTQNTKIDEKVLVRENSHKTASGSAKVTLVEFGDYQCPACGAAFPIVNRVLNDYKEKVNFVFRNFAFIGQESTWAAEASECANEQGKFWEYHDYLYDHQSGENKGTFSKDNLKTFAKDLKLDTNKFNSCLDSDKYSKAVSDDLGDGQSLGINSTPTFFLNNEKIVGVLSYDDFKKRIDSLLK